MDLNGVLLRAVELGATDVHLGTAPLPECTAKALTEKIGPSPRRAGAARSVVQTRYTSIVWLT
jgi:hypothetical protein